MPATIPCNMSHTLVLRSSLKPALKTAALLRGTVFATLGISLLLFGGVFLSKENLARWGLPILGAGFALITAGLLPYKSLTRLESEPHELLLIEDKSIRFSQHRKAAFTIPWASVEKTAYIDHPRNYGIGLWFKNPLNEKVVVHDPACHFEKMVQKSRGYGCDLFLPYFSKRSYQEMVDFFE